MNPATRKFVDYCDAEGIDLPERNFSIRYRSNIPRRVGLAGSSALVTATLRCLMEFYEVDIPTHMQPNVILSVETQELGISAGLQDRVIQVYEGCVFMDFNRELMEARGYGQYESIDTDLLPPLFVAYNEDLAEGSEVVHNNIRERWMNGDPEVVQAMKDFAGYAQEVHDLLLAGRGSEIGPWMDRNFDRRRSIYAIDSRHVEMVERARAVGAHAKFAGSGGAIIGTYADESVFAKLADTYRNTGVVLIRPQIAEGSIA